MNEVWAQSLEEIPDNPIQLNSWFLILEQFDTSRGKLGTLNPVFSNSRKSMFYHR